MRLETFQYILQTITEDHKAGIRFFTGEESDFDPASNKNYPANFVLPVQANMIINNSSEFVQQWIIIMEIKDILPQDRSTDDINEQLNTLFEILREIIIKFLFDYGFNIQTITVNNKEDLIDFTLATPIAILPFIDEGEQNYIGWQANFTINESFNPNKCNIDEQFNTI